MDVRSAMVNQRNTALKGVSNKIGSKYINLSVQDKCLRQEIPFYLVTFNELKHQRRLLKTDMMIHR